MPEHLSHNDYTFDYFPSIINRSMTTKNSMNDRKEYVINMGIELQFLDGIQKIHTPILDQVMRFVTSLGNASVVWILLAIVLLLIPKTRKGGVVLLDALCIEIILCNGILKNLFARTRPYEVNQAVRLLITKPKDYSFPSGHTAAAAVAVMALYLAKVKKVWQCALILAVLIAFSRMYFYVHYPTDILGGVLLGVISGLTGYWLVKRCPKLERR